MILTRKDLEEIKARAENATDGPWECGTDEGDHGNHPCVDFFPGGHKNSRATLPLDAGMLDEDAEFIAHSRTDIPRLVETIETLVRILQSEQELKEGKWRVLK